jgi:hypothetical protein
MEVPVFSKTDCVLGLKGDEERWQDRQVIEQQKSS